MCCSYRSGAVLLSRQALRPCGKCAWVKQTVQAVEWLKDEDLTLCTSVGMPTWELITSLGSFNDLNLKIFIPAKDPDDFERLSARTRNQFALNETRTRYVPVYTEYSGIDINQRRDRVIIERTDVILPVSIRPGGYINGLIDEFECGGKPVIREFAVEYESRGTSLVYKIPPESINVEMSRLANSYLIHWTRTSNTRWPTERLVDYYRAIIESDSYPRSACDTLSNILSTKTIKASSNHMPSKTCTVSFSNCPPEVMTKLMTWRARYRMMSFEPYGVGIEKQAALKMNVSPVKYYDADNDREIDRRHWLSQSRGRKADWITEDEYRHMGDFDLSGIDCDKLIVVCRTEAEAESISKLTGLRVVPFTNE